VHAKLDFLSPTGSFKDRNASMIATRLAHWGVPECAVDSSGNAGIACAAYCARAGITCSIYVPAGTSSGKTKLMKAYGAHVEVIDGSREQATEAALTQSEQTFYGGQTHSPFFEVGGLLWACEVWDALRKIPDAVVLPVGSGSLLLGAARGFSALSAATGSSRPRFYAIQASRCAPLADAFARGLSSIDTDHAWERSVAEGIATARPLRSEQLLDTVRASGGAFVAITDEEIESARNELLRTGLCVEPTGAAAVAGVKRLRANGILHADEAVVSALTGSGQKFIASTD
jgi:threonine synthase